MTLATDPTRGALSPTVTYLTNMRALWRNDPALAIHVDAVEDHERLPLERTGSGHWTGCRNRPDGQPVYLHSRHDPVAEATRFAASVSVEDKYCLVVNGMGLGYHLRALFDRLHGECVILCCEPSLETIATALTCTDLSEELSSGRLIVLHDIDKSRLHRRLSPHNARIMLGARFVRHGPSVAVDEPTHRAMISAVNDFLTFTRMTLVTLVGNSQITCRNIAMNLGTMVRTPPIDGLRGRFANHPAVVIAAGPSLTGDLNALASLQGRAVLIAVQTALRPLMARGIRPDFATSLDFHEMSRKFFEDVGDLRDTHLIAEPKAAWSVIDHYPGPVSLLENGWARLILDDAIPPRDGLPAGATVAHLAFYLAIYLGCDPIILVGQDLAFTGHVFYVPGVEIHHAWRSELNRFMSMEQKEWERIARNRPILRQVASNDGSALYTDELLFTYLEQFEKDIAGAGSRVIINTSEGGARIRGTRVMPLEEAARLYCTRPIDRSLFTIPEKSGRRDESRIPAARSAVQHRLDELDEVITVCGSFLDVLEELRGLTHDPPRFNQKLARVDELRVRVYRDARPYQIVNAATQLAELRRYSADRRIGAQVTDDVRRALRQIERDTQFVRGVGDGAREVKSILSAALARLGPVDDPADAPSTGRRTDGPS